jgi:hypothetical protein
MKTIYEWLLYHMGNEANFYTILNCQRSESSEADEHLLVMARTKDFKIIHLVIGGETGLASSGQESASAPDETRPQHLQFHNEQAVIHYLATGEVEQEESAASGSGVHVWVEEPKGEAGAITFPPEQSS